MKVLLLFPLLLAPTASHAQEGPKVASAPIPLRINSIPSDLSLETTKAQIVPFTALNPDTKPLRWSLTRSPSSWLTINTQTGDLSWSPPVGQDAIAQVRQAVLSGSLVLRTPTEVEVKVINQNDPTDSDALKFRVSIFATNIEAPRFRRITSPLIIQEGHELSFNVQCDFTAGQRINIVTHAPQGKGAVKLPTRPNELFTWLPDFDVVPANDPDRKVVERLFFEAKNDFNRRDTMSVYVIVEDRPDCKTDEVQHATQIREANAYLAQLQAAFITEHTAAEQRHRLRTKFDISAAVLGTASGTFGLLIAQTGTQRTTASVLGLLGATVLSIKLLAVPEDTKAVAREQELVAAINQLSRPLVQVRTFDCFAPTQKEQLQKLTTTQDQLLNRPELSQISLTAPASLNNTQFLRAKGQYEKRHEAPIETVK